MSETTRITVPVDPEKPGLFSYVHVWEPQVDKKTKNESYSMALLWKKSDKATTKLIKAAILEAIQEGNEGGFKGKKMSEKQIATYLDSSDYPLKDGDDKDEESYEGMYFIQPRSKTRPGVVDKDVEDILDKEELKSGFFGRLSVTFFPYNWEGKLGIGVALNNVQVIKKGKVLGGGGNRPPKDDFGTVDLDDDEEDYKPAKKKKRPVDDDDMFG